MKNILITGTYKSLPSGNVLYDINLWGQTTGTPAITLITFITMEMDGYSDLIVWSRERFCSYFNCIESNVTFLTHLIHIN